MEKNTQFWKFFNPVNSDSDEPQKRVRVRDLREGRAIAHGRLILVILAFAAIRRPNSIVWIRKSNTPNTLDSGFRRSGGVVISYAIVLCGNMPGRAGSEVPIAVCGAGSPSRRDGQAGRAAQVSYRRNESGHATPAQVLAARKRIQPGFW